MKNIHSIKREKKKIYSFFQIEEKYSLNAFDRVGLIVIAILLHLKFLSCCVCVFLSKKEYFFPFHSMSSRNYLYFIPVYIEIMQRKKHCSILKFVVFHPLHSSFYYYIVVFVRIRALSVTVWVCVFFFHFNSIILSLSFPCIRLSLLLFTSIKFLLWILRSKPYTVCHALVYF